MQTLNILENQDIGFNAFKAFDNTVYENSNRRLVLMEQLQTTLDLHKLLNTFAMEAAKFVDFSGLYFKGSDLSASLRGSRRAKNERQFELKINNQFIGILTYAINSPISLPNYKILNELHQHLIYPIHNAIQYKSAMALAMQDGLTSLGNRRYFDEQIKRAMHQANRQHKQVGLLVGDLNKFKAVNDTHGHHVGDEILIHFADALKASIRDSDSVFRFGGDEFAIIVEDACSQSLSVIEERIHLAMKNDHLLDKYKVSCCLGSTFMNRADNEKTLFKRADQALYRQKLMLSRSLKLV
jgi:diguanylate cyclase (GGDEF)-like protein